MWWKESTHFNQKTILGPRLNKIILPRFSGRHAYVEKRDRLSEFDPFNSEFDIMGTILGRGGGRLLSDYFIGNYLRNVLNNLVWIGTIPDWEYECDTGVEFPFIFIRIICLKNYLIKNYLPRRAPCPPGPPSEKQDALPPRQDPPINP